ncbi:MAG: Proline racemase [Acetothermia bacterium 64_32]|nr:MAG: Proline racemase [Acetothermia bacterium 64_32]MBC7098700.1 proline racemase family protein [Candidatus Bipolaricaulota bacterium]HAF71149.1 proline racemase [Candidatus Acetothermia bacterium]
MDLERMRNWRPPSGWPVITAIDAHAAGEPLRVIVSGWPELLGPSVLERRRAAKEHFDHLRTALMWEPRGHADMYGCLLMPPVSQDAHFSVLFMHNEGYSTMCGHGIIAVVTVVLETGLFPLTCPETELRIDTPAGKVTALARVEAGRVAGVRFRNVPSFVVALDEEVEVPGLGRVRYDLAFGGAFYVFVREEEVGIPLEAKSVPALIRAGTAIKRAVSAARPVRHPLEEELSFLYGTIFVGPPRTPGAHSRNVCVFADGEVDRSPTGTGVSARLALHCLRGEIGLGESLRIESVIGTSFTGKVVEETKVGPLPAVVPEVEGQAYITGVHEFVLAPDDPLKHGFLLGREDA